MRSASSPSTTRPSVAPRCAGRSPRRARARSGAGPSAASGAVSILLLAGCPDAGTQDEATTQPPPTTSLTGDGSTQGPDAGSATEPADTATGCTPGLPGCACLPDDACMGELVCEAGTCREPGDSESGTDDTTTGTPAACGNGIAEPGDLCLGAATPLAMGAGSIALVIANFDADPALDIVVANRDADTISIRLGDGNGGFGVQSPFATGTGPIAVGAGDFDGDGNLDLATANVGSIDVTVLPGLGNGNFDPAAAVATPLGELLVPTDLAVTDLEGDGDPDVLVTEGSMSLVHVLRRDLGAFLPAATYPVGGGPSSLHLADFSGDGVLDLVTANADAGTVSLLLGNGFGQLGGANGTAAGDAPADVGAGDFNGDGDTDTVVANPSGSVTIGYGNGLGGLGGQLPFPVPGGPVALVAADLDLDGDTDVAVAGSDGMVHVLLGNGAGAVTPALDIAVGQDPQDIAAADLNGDGLLDLVTANTGSGNVSVILTGA